MLNIFASLKAIRYTTGAAVPLWVIVIWVIPVIGAITALIAIRRRPIEAPVKVTSAPIRGSGSTLDTQRETKVVSH